MLRGNDCYVVEIIVKGFFGRKRMFFEGTVDEINMIEALLDDETGATRNIFASNFKDLLESHFGWIHVELWEID